MHEQWCLAYGAVVVSSICFWSCCKSICMTIIRHQHAEQLKHFTSFKFDQRNCYTKFSYAWLEVFWKQTDYLSFTYEINWYINRNTTIQNPMNPLMIWWFKYARKCTQNWWLSSSNQLYSHTQSGRMQHNHYHLPWPISTITIHQLKMWILFAWKLKWHKLHQKSILAIMMAKEI